MAKSRALADLVDVVTALDAGKADIGAEIVLGGDLDGTLSLPASGGPVVLQNVSVPGLTPLNTPLGGSMFLTGLKLWEGIWGVNQKGVDFTQNDGMVDIVAYNSVGNLGLSVGGNLVWHAGNHYSNTEIDALIAAGGGGVQLTDDAIWTGNYHYFDTTFGINVRKYNDTAKYSILGHKSLAFNGNDAGQVASISVQLDQFQSLDFYSGMGHMEMRNHTGATWGLLFETYSNTDILLNPHGTGTVKINGNEVWDAGNLTPINPDTTNTFSVMQNFYVPHNTTLDDHQSSPISIRERGLVGSAQSSDAYAPNINFHWAGRISNSLWMNYLGDFHLGGYESNGVPSTPRFTFDLNDLELRFTNRKAIGAADSWLRINDTGAFTSGIYFGSSLVRTDGAIQVGESGSTLFINGSTFTYKGSNIWYGGNFNPDTYQDGLAVATVTSTGWYTIAESSGSRGFAKITLSETNSGQHALATFEWTRAYVGSKVVVRNHTSHGSSGVFTHCRVVYDSADQTYAKQYLQVYIPDATTRYLKVTIEDRNRYEGFKSTISVRTPVLENTIAGFTNGVKNYLRDIHVGNSGSHQTVSTSAPDNSYGDNGDVWYKV